MTKAELPYIELPGGHIEESCAGKDDVRYYLQYPFLDMDGDTPMLVATNGHILTAFRVAVSGKVATGPLPIEAIKVARKGRNVEVPRLYFDGDKVGDGTTWITRPAYDFKFPYWRKVIPDIDDSSDPDIALNEQYLSVLSKSLNGTARHITTKGVRIWLAAEDDGQIAPDKGMLVKPASAINGDGFSVLMPMRG